MSNFKVGDVVVVVHLPKHPAFFKYCGEEFEVVDLPGSEVCACCGRERDRPSSYSIRHADGNCYGCPGKHLRRKDDFKPKETRRAELARRSA